jgi:chorismate mutase
MTNLQRIKRILQFNYKRGVNKESVNEVYRKIIAKCKICGLQNGNHKISCYNNKANKG